MSPGHPHQTPVEGPIRGSAGPMAAGHCLRCKKWVPKGPDICLGLIPGVSHACCGHGRTEAAYVTLGGRPDQSTTEFESVTLRGAAALTFFVLVKQGEHWEATR